MLARYEQHRRRNRMYPHFFLFFILCSMQGMAQQAGSLFTARLINLEAASNTTFTYNARLTNPAKAPRVYQLFANVPPGWNIAYKTEGYQVTSLNVDSGKTQDISIEINPALETKPGKYNITVTALAGADSLKLNLEAVVKGTYNVTLSTPSGRLSDEITEGSRREIQLVVKNTGSIALDNLELSSQAPPQWEASFSPATIKQLEPNKEASVTVTLKVPNKTIAGDYVSTFTVKNNNATSNATFRMTVTTSILTGWLGILIILLALGAVYYLIRKYGRR